MTGGAARQFLNFIFPHQFSPQSELVRRQLVIHAEHVFAWPDEALRFAVAREAPFHIERVFAPRQRHLIDLAMAGRTTDAFMDVNAVIEVNKPRKIVNPGPLNRLARAKAFSHGRQHGTISPDLGVAVHAGFGRRNPRERTFLDRRMAITAVNSVIANVVFVAERNRLNTGDPDF